MLRCKATGITLDFFSVSGMIGDLVGILQKHLRRIEVGDCQLIVLRRGGTDRFDLAAFFLQGRAVQLIAKGQDGMAHRGNGSFFGVGSRSIHEGNVPPRQDHRIQRIGVGRAGTKLHLLLIAVESGCFFQKTGLAAAGSAFDEKCVPAFVGMFQFIKEGEKALRAVCSQKEANWLGFRHNRTSFCLKQNSFYYIQKQARWFAEKKKTSVFAEVSQK